MFQNVCKEERKKARKLIKLFCNNPSKEKLSRAEKNIHSPSHDVPFPLYPLLQAQLYVPSALVQSAFSSQSCVLFEHSSISVQKT
jgi:hypothetical protein